MTQNTIESNPSVSKAAVDDLSPEMRGLIVERAYAEPFNSDGPKVLGMFSRMQNGEWNFEPAPLTVEPQAAIEITIIAAP